MWNNDFNSALINAQKSNKLVFVDFYADWCGYCKELDEKTYPDQGVQQRLAQKYVAVKVNVDQNPDLATKYNIYGLPTLVIIRIPMEMKLSGLKDIKHHQNLLTCFKET